ncbi:hypothetical protein JCM11251_002344 [Rhodosporidiobolus azoricus]
MMDLTLSTSCGECGSAVAVEVPRWMLLAMENSTVAGGELDDLGDGQRRRTDSDGGSSEKRRGIVGAAVGAAQLVKASPLPGLFISLFRTIFAFIIYVDACFSLHQRLALVLAAFFEGIVEIEREVGIMKNAGDWMSIGWEATVRGIIAFAKTDSPSHPSRQPAPANMQRYSRHRAQVDRHGSSSSLGASYEDQYPSHSPKHPHYHGDSSFPFNSPGLHLEVPSNESSNVGYIYSDSSSSSRTATQQSYTVPRSLRRAPHSSPSLQTAYLASHPGSSPTDSASFSLSSSPSDTSLPPYTHDRDRLSFGTQLSMHPANANSPTRPRMARQRSASGPDTTSPTRPDMGGRGSSWAGKAVMGLAERMKVL